MSVRSSVHQSPRRLRFAEGPLAGHRSRVDGRSIHAAAGWIGSIIGFGLIVACVSPDESELFDAVPKTEAFRTNPGMTMVTGAEVTMEAVGADPEDDGVSSAAESEAQDAEMAPPAKDAADGGSETPEGSTAPDPGGGADAGSPEESGTAGAAPPAIACDAQTESCDGIDNDCDGLIDEDSVCPLPCIGFEFAGFGYEICPPIVDVGLP